MDILWFFLPGIILLGIITSIEDIKEKKIRNKWVVSALAYSFFVNLFLIVYFNITSGVRVSYVIELFTNIFFAIIIGFGFWYGNIWTAGDGKLFIAFSSLLPLSVFSYGYIRWVPSTTLLLNIFISGFAMMAGIILLKKQIKDILMCFFELLESFLDTKKLLSSALHIFSLFWIIGLGLSFLEIKQNLVLKLVLAFLIFIMIGNKKYFFIFLLSVALVRLILDRTVFTVDFLKNLTVTLFIWHGLRYMLKEGMSKLGKGIFSKEIKVSDLKPGMMLLEDILKSGKKYRKEPKGILKNKKSIINEEAEGITKNQIKKIQKTGIKTILVSRTIPFAPLIFLGVLLTVAAKGNILILLTGII